MLVGLLRRPTIKGWAAHGVSPGGQPGDQVGCQLGGQPGRSARGQLGGGRLARGVSTMGQP